MRNVIRSGWILLLLFCCFSAIQVSRVAADENTGICFSFPDMEGEPGSEVLMPFQVSHADSIVSVDAQITYPASELTALAVDKTSY